uniref:Uncharacterized protein n=1 Tax=Anguilla anguilla TaxID=7936 RepID=A0A0E9SLC3_ANGAN
MICHFMTEWAMCFEIWLFPKSLKLFNFYLVIASISKTHFYVSHS